MSQDALFSNEDHSIANLPGFYTIDVKEDGTYLTVFPPQGTGASVKEGDVLTELRARDIPGINNEMIAHTIKHAAGVPIKVAMPLEQEQDPDVIIDISRDRLEARLRVNFPKHCKTLTAEHIQAAISLSKISYGLDTTIIQKVLDKPNDVHVVARGLSPVNGENARVVYHIDFEKSSRPEELEDGRVDYKSLNLFHTVQQGQLLAEKIPCTDGTPGIDIYGEVCGAKPGKDVKFPMGKNVELVPSTFKMVAAISGQVVMSGGKICVLPVIEIRGDVDFSTGNIDFIGNVIIQGSVQTGFTVKADGDVQIAGTVSGGIVEGRNVIIRMGIQGMNRGYIKASETLTAKFIENAVIYAGTEVKVSEAIMHSKIYAGKRVVVDGKRGLIVGGTICAGEEIRAKAIGSSLATPTDIEVGVNPGLREEYAAVRKELPQVETELDQTKKALNILKAMNQATMPAEKKQLLLKMTKASFHLLGKSETLRNRMMEIELAFEEMKFGKVKASDFIYSGVKVTVGTQSKPIRDTLKFVTLYNEDGEIKIGSFS